MKYRIKYMNIFETYNDIWLAKLGVKIRQRGKRMLGMMWDA